MAQHARYVHAHDSVNRFVDELGTRVVAKTGIPSDTYHLGKIILQSLKEAPGFVHQIDGSTDEYETNSSVLERSIRCAIVFKNLGLVKDDVMTIMAPNHIDVAIPFYAALYTGIVIASIDANLELMELEASFRVNRPKIILCQSEKTTRITEALKNVQIDATVVTFDQCNGFLYFREILDTQGGDENAVQEFKPTDFDPEETIALVAATSGSTGLPQGVALTHKNLRISIAYNWLGFEKFPTPSKSCLVLAPLQWLSAIFNFVYSPIVRYTRIQTSKAISKDDIFFLINKYRPTFTFVTPTLMTALLNREGAAHCDFSCLEDLFVGGANVPQTVVDDIKKCMPKVNIRVRYGLSEAGGLTFYDPFPPKMSLGRPVGCLSYRLVNKDTHEDIYEPNVPGELWLKGPTTCKGYYNNPEATAKVYEDGWLKTGDILYRDEHWNFYYVDRLKQILKYKSNQIAPIELEAVIRQHPGVLEVAVTGITDPECGELPVACVIRKPGWNVTAQEIKELIKGTLSDFKQLRGGVAFVDELPLTVTTKINRKKLKELAPTLIKE